MVIEDLYINTSLIVAIWLFDIAAHFATVFCRLKVVALETAGSGITCNAVSPGYVDTPSTFTAFCT